MEFRELCDALERIAGTRKRLEKTHHLAKLIAKVPEKDMGGVLLLLRGRVFPEWDRTTLGVSDKLVIKAINTATGIPLDKIVQRFKKLGDLGEVAAELVKQKKQATLVTSDLDVEDVVRTLRKLPSVEGIGSVGQKLRIISSLLTSAQGIEAKYLARIILEDLRVGIAEGTIRDAIVWRSLMDREKLSYDLAANEWTGPPRTDVPAIVACWREAVQDAIDRSNDVARVALTAREGGIEGLQGIQLELGRPLRVMLAQRSLDIDDAFARVGRPAAIEYKYDGFRMQVHVFSDGAVRLFTRRLEDVTVQFPDVVEAIRQNIKKSCILDCEVIGYDRKRERHVPFQQISQRIRRKYDIERLAEELPVEVCVFDILLFEDAQVYQQPWRERRRLIEEVVPVVDGILKPSDLLITGDKKDVEPFYAAALGSGYEGLMFKTPDALYRPGSRVGFMVKLKPTLDTLDLVIVGAEWGEGKRSGWLTSFTVACRDHDDEYLVIGRVGTGFKELETEDGVTFQEMTSLLQDDIVAETGKEVEVRPKVVMEIKFEEIQKSPTYGSGFALRFPRVVQIRPDRRPDEISTIGEVLDLYEAQRGRGN